MQSESIEYLHLCQSKQTTVADKKTVQAQRFGIWRFRVKAIHPVDIHHNWLCVYLLFFYLKKRDQVGIAFPLFPLDLTSLILY